MKIAIVGSRTRGSEQDYKNLCDLMDQFHATAIVSGGAIGADSLGARYAKEKSLPLILHLPDWKLHGKSAGFIRNRAIVEDADYIVALWDGKSKGTRHTMDLALNAGNPITVIGDGGECYTLTDATPDRKEGE